MPRSSAELIRGSERYGFPKNISSAQQHHTPCAGQSGHAAAPVAFAAGETLGQTQRNRGADFPAHLTISSSHLASAPESQHHSHERRGRAQGRAGLATRGVADARARARAGRQASDDPSAADPTASVPRVAF